MNTRPPVPINVNRALWAESVGICMNPECKKPLLPLINGTKISIADIAHIEPHSQGGGVSEDNLLLLCKNCHKKYEPIDFPEVKEELRSWKEKRKKDMQEEFDIKFKTFDELSARVKPLLVENYEIFNHYGPHTNDSEAFKLWQKFEPQIIVNNAKLKLLFAENMDLFPSDGKYDNKKAIAYFNLHVDEFFKTRENFDGVRKVLFPWRILSIFGIKPEPYSQENSISTIQNMILSFQKKGYKVDLDLLDEPHIKIEKDGESEIVYLNDNPRISQLAFSEKAHTPSSTEMRLDNLQLYLKFIENTGARWSFDNISDLTVVTINGYTKIKLFYSYTLSVAELEAANLDVVRHVANLHNWNGGPITIEAIKFACSMKVKAMTSKKFFLFIRRHGS